MKTGRQTDQENFDRPNSKRLRYASIASNLLAVRKYGQITVRGELLQGNMAMITIEQAPGTDGFLILCALR